VGVVLMNLVVGVWTCFQNSETKCLVASLCICLFVVMLSRSSQILGRVLFYHQPAVMVRDV